MKISAWMFKKRQRLQTSQSSTGFTLVEVLVVVVIATILAAMAAYSLQGWLNRLRVNTVQDKVLNAFLEAQNRSRQQASNWQVSFKQIKAPSGELDINYAIHPAEQTDLTKVPWRTIDEPGVQIDTDTNYTNLNPVTSGGDTVWSIQFDNKGNLQRDTKVPAIISLSFKGTYPRRCVQVVTLLGATRSEGDGDCKTK